MIIAPGNQNLIQKALRYFFLFFLFVVLLGTALVGVQWFSNSVEGFFLGASASTQQLAALAQPIVDDTPVHRKITSDIEAEVAFSVEISPESRTMLFEKESAKPLPIASLTKLMTALVVLERYDLSQKVIISAAAMAQEGEQGSLRLGETLSARNLLFIMLMESSNRAAYALADVMGQEVFVAAMNSKAAELGMAQTHFGDSSGLSSTSYSSAADIAILSQHLFEQYPLFRDIIRLPQYDLYVNGKLHHTLINTNKLLDMDNIMGGKTGWTDEARGCFMAIERMGTSGNYIIHIILGADERFLEMQKLIHIVSLREMSRSDTK